MRAIAARRSRLCVSASSTSAVSVGSLKSVHQRSSAGSMAVPAGRSSAGGAVGVVVQPAAMKATNASAMAGLRMFVSVRGKRRMVIRRVRLEVRDVMQMPDLVEKLVVAPPLDEL